MKLTIDTQQDSYEDLRKVLQILAQILKRKGAIGSGEAVDTTNFDTTNLMGMFDYQSDSTNATDVNSPLNLSKLSRPEKKAVIEKVEVY